MELIMKKLLLISVFAVFSTGLLRAQTDSTLTVDCGENIVICPGDFYALITSYALDEDLKNENLDTLFIGRNVKVAGGVEPYTYTWSCNAQPWYNGSFSLNANDFLNDITSANPYIIYEPLENVTVFRLQVTDAEGNVAVDSLTLYRETFTCVMEYPYLTSSGNPVYITGNDLGMSSLYPMTHFAVFKGDTIDLPASFEFQRNDSITIFSIDSVGCKVEPATIHYRNIWFTSIDESIINDNVVKLVANTLYFNDASEKQIRIYSTNGQLLYSKNTTDTRLDIPLLKNTNHCVCSVIVNNKSYSFHLLTTNFEHR